jgi:hypothetical protein
MKLDKHVPQVVIEALDTYFLHHREQLPIPSEVNETINLWKTGKWEEDFMCYYGKLWLNTFRIDFGAIQRIRRSLTPDITLALLRIKLCDMHGKQPPLLDTMKISTWRAQCEEHEAIFNEFKLDEEFRKEMRTLDLIKSRIPQRWEALEKRLTDNNDTEKKKHKYWSNILRFTLFNEPLLQVYPGIKWMLTILAFLSILYFASLLHDRLPHLSLGKLLPSN